MTPDGEACPLVTPAERARFGQVQAYEDAIAYRRSRLAAACAGCGPVRCDEHAADAELIAVYKRAAGAVTRSCDLWPGDPVPQREGGRDQRGKWGDGDPHVSVMDGNALFK